MIRQMSWGFATLITVCSFSATVAHAQAVGQAGLPEARPAVSPYLNLLRRGNSPAANYFNLVRPQIQAQNNIQKLQQSQNATQRDVNALEASSGLPQTGHNVRFGDTGGFFLSGSAAFGGSVPGAGSGSRAGTINITRPTVAPPASASTNLPSFAPQPYTGGAIRR